MDMRFFEISDIEYAAFLLCSNEIRKYKYKNDEDLEILILVYAKRLKQHGYHTASKMMREFVFKK